MGHADPAGCGTPARLDLLLGDTPIPLTQIVVRRLAVGIRQASSIRHSTHRRYGRARRQYESAPWQRPETIAPMAEDEDRQDRLASVARVRIGAELRRLRERAGLSGEQVARKLGWSQPKVSRIEMGRTTATVQDVARLLAVYGVGDEARAAVLAAAAEEVGETTWIIRAGALPQRQESMAILESVTRRICQFQPVLVPGLLQTADYARHVAAAMRLRDPERLVAARLQRQQALRQATETSYQVVLDARALLLRICPVPVLRAQIVALGEAAGHPAIDLRVIPVGAYCPVLSTAPFGVYEFLDRRTPSVVFVETLAGDSYFSAPEDVKLYLDTFDALGAQALPDDATVDYLRAFAADLDASGG